MGVGLCVPVGQGQQSARRPPWGLPRWRAEQAHLRQGSVSRRLRHLRQRCLALEAQIEECVQQGNVFECQHCASADVGNRCCSCQGSSTSTATLPGTVTETTTTSPALPGQCKAWCASNGKSWEKKCKWTGCAGCPSCNTRRLGASNRLLV